jgi:hypothetical protein
MIDFFLWVENLEFSAFLRESSSLLSFPIFLYVHTLGMSIFAGSAAMICFALLGVWPKGAPLAPLERFYPLLWIGLGIEVITGVSIFMKDASTYGRNTDFYIKLLLVAIGVVLLVLIRTRVLRSPEIGTGVVPPAGRMLAWASILCWAGVIITGRLIAYLQPVPGDF